MNTSFQSSSMNSKSDFFSIKLPEYRKPKLELWAFISLNDLDTLLACLDSHEFLKSDGIRHQLKLTEYKRFTNLISQQLNLDQKSKKDLIIIDKYYYIAKFGIANDFTKEQISCIFLIMKRIHELAIETSFGNMDETFDYFKKQLVIHGVHRPPYSLKMFSIKEIELISDYVFDVYFKQFKFYKYVFSLAVRLDLKFRYSHLSVETMQGPEESSALVNVENAKNDSAQAKDESQIFDNLKETLEDDNKEKISSELKDFIRSYLSDKLKKMKDELSIELNPKPLTEKTANKKK